MGRPDALSAAFLTNGNARTATAAHRTRTKHTHPCVGQHGPPPLPAAARVPGKGGTAAPHPVDVCGGFSTPFAHTTWPKASLFSPRLTFGFDPASAQSYGRHSMPSQDQPAGNSPDARRVSVALQVLRWGENTKRPTRSWWAVLWMMHI